jgi:hypothetical protein
VPLLVPNPVNRNGSQRYFPGDRRHVIFANAGSKHLNEYNTVATHGGKKQSKAFVFGSTLPRVATRWRSQQQRKGKMAASLLILFKENLLKPGNPSPFGGKSLKPGNPYCGLTDNQLMTNDQQSTAEKLKYSRHRERRHWRPTNNMFEVWQNSAPLIGRLINGAVEALLMKIVNRQSKVLPIIVLFS